MVKNSTLAFGFILLLAIITSGCINYKDATLSINPDIDVKINEVNYSECHLKEPCLYINMGIENNRKESVSLKIDSATLVTKDGKQIENTGGSDPTPSYVYGIFRLFPNAKTNFTRSFPIVYKNDNPVLYIGLIEVRTNEEAVTKEYTFNLTSYLNS